MFLYYILVAYNLNLLKCGLIYSLDSFHVWFFPNNFIFVLLAVMSTIRFTFHEIISELILFYDTSTLFTFISKVLDVSLEKKFVIDCSISHFSFIS